MKQTGTFETYYMYMKYWTYFLCSKMLMTWKFQFSYGIFCIAILHVHIIFPISVVTVNIYCSLSDKIIITSVLLLYIVSEASGTVYELSGFNCTIHYVKCVACNPGSFANNCKYNAYTLDIYSQTCLIQYLCNPFHLVIWHCCSFLLDYFLCFFWHCAIWHPVYSNI